NRSPRARPIGRQSPRPTSPSSSKLPQVPTFRSSYAIAAPPLTNFEKSRAPANFMILVPLPPFEVPESNSPLVAQELQMGGTSLRQGAQTPDATISSYGVPRQSAIKGVNRGSML